MKVKCKLTSTGDCGVLEKFQEYLYNNTVRLKAILVADRMGRFVEPAIYRSGAFVPISQSGVDVSRYVNAKKPIYGVLNENTVITQWVLHYDFYSKELQDVQCFCLRPDPDTLIEEKNGVYLFCTPLETVFSKESLLYTTLLEAIKGRVSFFEKCISVDEDLHSINPVAVVDQSESDWDEFNAMDEEGDDWNCADYGYNFTQLA